MGSLRILLALTVVMGHAGKITLFVGGKNAVQLFYIISGFLISYILVESKSYPKKTNFYLNRWLRLYPLYASVAILTLLLYVIIDQKSFFDLYKSLPVSADIFLFMTNTLLLGQDLVLFAGIENNALVFASDFRNSAFPLWHGLLIPQAWTLGIELSFYLIAPFVLVRRRYIFSLLICSLALRGILILNGIGRVDPWTYRFFPTELALFLLGSLSHQLILPLFKKHLSAAALDNASVVATISLIAISTLYLKIPIEEIYRQLLYFPLFLFLLPLTFIFQNNYRFDRRLGDLSYPLYIGHMLIILIVTFLFERIDVQSVSMTLLACVSLSVVFAHLLNISIGRIVEDLRLRIKGIYPVQSKKVNLQIEGPPHPGC